MFIELIILKLVYQILFILSIGSFDIAKYYVNISLYNKDLRLNA